MKKLFLLAAFALATATGFAQGTQQVNGYTRSNGTYVQPYTKTTSDGTNTNNYSTQGNSNPNTGQTGTKAPDYSQQAQNYGSGRTVQTGPRGGQYYVNDNGKKVYVPKQN
jgi:Ni/Co efflux regulator RcnB